MSTSRSIESPSTAEYARWRQAHEVHALRDTLALYRQSLAALAAENARLHEQLADVSVGALRSDGKRGRQDPR